LSGGCADAPFLLVQFNNHMASCGLDIEGAISDRFANIIPDFVDACGDVRVALRAT
jgi:hypothetical protein